MRLSTQKWVLVVILICLSYSYGENNKLQRTVSVQELAQRFGGMGMRRRVQGDSVVRPWTGRGGKDTHFDENSFLNRQQPKGNNPQEQWVKIDRNGFIRRGSVTELARQFDQRAHQNSQSVHSRKTNQDKHVRMRRNDKINVTTTPYQKQKTSASINLMSQQRQNQRNSTASKIEQVLSQQRSTTKTAQRPSPQGNPQVSQRQTPSVNDLQQQQRPQKTRPVWRLPSSDASVGLLSVNQQIRPEDFKASPESNQQPKKIALIPQRDQRTQGNQAPQKPSRTPKNIFQSQKVSTSHVVPSASNSQSHVPQLPPKKGQRDHSNRQAPSKNNMNQQLQMPSKNHSTNQIHNRNKNEQNQQRSSQLTSSNLPSPKSSFHNSKNERNEPQIHQSQHKLFSSSSSNKQQHSPMNRQQEQILVNLQRKLSIRPGSNNHQFSNLFSSCHQIIYRANTQAEKAHQVYQNAGKNSFNQQYLNDSIRALKLATAQLADCAMRINSVPSQMRGQVQKDQSSTLEQLLQLTVQWTQYCQQTLTSCEQMSMSLNGKSPISLRHSTGSSPPDSPMSVSSGQHPPSLPRSNSASSWGSSSSSQGQEFNPGNSQFRNSVMQRHSGDQQQPRPVPWNSKQMPKQVPKPVDRIHQPANYRSPQTQIHTSLDQQQTNPGPIYQNQQQIHSRNSNVQPLVQNVNYQRQTGRNQSMTGFIQGLRMMKQDQTTSHFQQNSRLTQNEAYREQKKQIQKHNKNQKSSTGSKSMQRITKGFSKFGKSIQGRFAKVK